jgi:hypothetical protein
MFQALRKRIHITPATAIATLALVFAMTGGAYAANKFLITSTKQISPKVLKALKGAKGANGAVGLAGAAGAQGPAGPAGAAGVGTAGAQGSPGTPGESVTNTKLEKGAVCKEGGAEFKVGSSTTHACNGEKGAKGEEGNIKATLPSGVTETGAVEAGTPSPTSKSVVFMISFPIPLEKALPSANAVFVSAQAVAEGKIPTGCSGTTEEPKAEKGHLCVFEGYPEGVAAHELYLPGTKITSLGAGTTGALGNFKITTEGGFITLTWAVTGE